MGVDTVYGALEEENRSTSRSRRGLEGGREGKSMRVGGRRCWNKRKKEQEQDMSCLGRMFYLRDAHGAIRVPDRADIHRVPGNGGLGGGISLHS